MSKYLLWIRHFGQSAGLSKNMIYNDTGIWWYSGDIWDIHNLAQRR